MTACTFKSGCVCHPPIARNSHATRHTRNAAIAAEVQIMRKAQAIAIHCLTIECNPAETGRIAGPGGNQRTEFRMRSAKIPRITNPRIRQSARHAIMAIAAKTLGGRRHSPCPLMFGMAFNAAALWPVERGTDP